MSDTIIINLIGGPQSGKTTTATGLFSELKKTGMDVEFVGDIVKPHMYEEHKGILSHQIALFAEQLYKIDSLVGKVDCIIQDGSLLLNAVYDKTNNQLFKALVTQEYSRFKNLDFFLNREGIKYNINDTIYTQAEALVLDKKIIDIYNFSGAPIININATNSINEILNYIAAIEA